MQSMPSTSQATAVLLLASLLTAPVGAQILSGVLERRFTLRDGVYFGDGMGTSVSAAGDVNQDGFTDMIVGNPFNAHFGTRAGAAFVYSGKDGVLLWSFFGRHPEELLGFAVADAGDVDRDGFADVIVGAPTAADFRGSAIVYSGKGSVIWRFDGAALYDRMGHSVAGGVDVNQDGFPDLIVGSPGADPGGRLSAGSVFVYSGKDGTLLSQFDGGKEGDNWGSAVAPVGIGWAGDVNHDGFPDVIVGAEYADARKRNSGSALVYSGGDGSVLWRFDGGRERSRMGHAVAGAGDLDQDGFPDIIVAADWAHPGGVFEAGSVFVFSGRNGSVLRRFDGKKNDDELGTSVAGAGDVNKDGFADILVGANRMDSAFLYSGRDGTVLWQFHGESLGDRLGFAVAAAGDMDGDGLADVILGAPGAQFNGQPGYVQVHGYRPVVVAYGTGLPGSRNVTPVLRTGERPQIGTDLEIDLLGGLGLAPCVIVGSTTRTETSLLGMTLYGDFLTPGAFSTWGFVTSGIPGFGGTGRATVRMQIPGDPSLAGLTTYWQGFVMDQGSSAPVGVSHTRGLAVTVVR